MKKEQKNWYAVEIETEPGAEEAIEFALNDLDSLGNEIKQLGKKTSENLTVIGYFNERINDTILRVKLNESLQIYGFSNETLKNVRWREIEDQDWLAEWKKHWQPTETSKFIIAPVWFEVEDTDKIIIRIEPSMAFGTGTHETTRLCLKAIEENYRDGESFLDVGTGTGILAIAAAKLLTKIDKRNPKTLYIFACDTDEKSVEIALENASINEVEDKIGFYKGSIRHHQTPESDFVCANLTADVIVPLLPLLIEKSKRVLVLSGILKEQEDLIVEELEKFGIENPRVETDGEWISVRVTTVK